MPDPEAEWDVSELDLTDAAIEGRCPSCEGYLHPYAATCFGCNYDRGSAYGDLLIRWRLITEAPVLALQRSSYIAQVIKATGYLDDAIDEPAFRHLCWRAIHHVYGVHEGWPQIDPRRQYLGGLEAAPYAEYIRFAYEDGRIVLEGDRSRARLASIEPAAVLGVAPCANYDDVLGGRTFGFIGGGAVVFETMQPTEGGALRIAFADGAGVWRLAVVGNRTGLTDKRYEFGAYRLTAKLMRYLCLVEMADAEWRLGPHSYARTLGLDLPETAPVAPLELAGDEEKICPDCAETIKAAARICRYCRHEFWPEGSPPPPGGQ